MSNATGLAGLVLVVKAYMSNPMGFSHFLMLEAATAGPRCDTATAWGLADGRVSGGGGSPGLAGTPDLIRGAESRGHPREVGACGDLALKPAGCAVGSRFSRPVAAGYTGVGTLVEWQNAKSGIHH